MLDSRIKPESFMFVLCLGMILPSTDILKPYRAFYEGHYLTFIKMQLTLAIQKTLGF